MTPHLTSSPFHSQHPRGIAILLVLISLMMATILTSAYLASRDNSSLIGDNVAAAAKARWAASSGLEMSVAVLQTETSWRTSHVNGKLIDDLNVDGALVDVDLLDMQTNAPPTLSTTTVKITTTAVADGVTQTSSAIASIQPDDSEVDIGLTEFTAFGKESVSAKDQAVFARWETAPMSKLGHPIYVGTQSLSSGAVSIDNGAAIIDGYIFASNTASASLISSASTTPVVRENVKSVIPLPSGPSAPLYVGLYGAALAVTAGTTNVASSVAKTSVDVNSGGVLNIQDGVTLNIKTYLHVNPGGKIVINGNVVISVKKDMQIQQGSIELMPNAVLLLFVTEDILADQSYLGDLRADSSRDNSGSASYVDPSTIQVYSTNVANSTEWRFRDNTVAKGLYYAPNRKLRIEDNSAIYGSVAAQQVEVTDNGAIFYDPALDSAIGYTNPKSALYNPDGTIISSVLSLLSLDQLSLSTLSTATSLQVKSRGKVVSGFTVVDAGLRGSLNENDPTPRPVQVDFNMDTFGSDTSIDEARAVAAANAG
ncbi:MAG TPA: hypothetical protein VG711_00825 [Phycisphaerales bacterium]|nr:hypothetical protein [Phycisphaerales bacterium]